MLGMYESIGQEYCLVISRSYDELIMSYILLHSIDAVADLID
jgi:hypothetical protein